LDLNPLKSLGPCNKRVLAVINYLLSISIFSENSFNLEHLSFHRKQNKEPFKGSFEIKEKISISQAVENLLFQGAAKGQ